MALLLLKASVLLAAALVIARLARRSPAATRHGVWSLAFAALLALPLLAYGLPAIHVPVPAPWRMLPSDPTTMTARRSPGDPPSSLGIASGPASTLADANDSAVTSGRRTAAIQIAAILIALWAGGTVIALGVLGVSLLRVRKLARTATPLVDERWVTAADAVAGRVGLRRRARLVTSDSIRTPMAGGLTRPTVFLPTSALAWTDERRDMILAHELSHLAGRDPLRHIAARLAVALYWFHPLAWVAAREASVAREQACDEAVLALGTRPSSYAQALLDFADASSLPGRALAALPIVERSLLEKRLMAILTDDRSRTRRSRPLIPITAIGILAIAVAAARPAALAPSADGRTGDPSDLTVAVPAAQNRNLPGFACDAPWDASFSGSMSSDERGGHRVVYDAVGTVGADRIVLRSFDDLRVCMIAEDFAGSDSSLRPSEWPGRAKRVVLETRRGGVVQRLVTTRVPGGAPGMVWTVGGVERPFDAVAQEWRDRILALLDTSWEGTTIRGEVSSLHGQISSLKGEESSLHGTISSVKGEVSSMQGEISSIRGRESSLQGEISSLRGHLSSLEGEISSERGAISALQASRFNADAAKLGAELRQHEAEIARLQEAVKAYDADAKIAEVQRQLRAFDADGEVAKVQARLRDVDIAARVAEVEKRIRALDVDGNIAALQRKISAVDADRRLQKLDTQLADDLRRLQELLAKIR